MSEGIIHPLATKIAIDITLLSFKIKVTSTFTTCPT